MKAIIMAWAGVLALMAPGSNASASEMTTTAAPVVQNLLLHDCDAISPGKSRSCRHSCHERLQFKGQDVDGHCTKLHHYDGECDDKESADVHEEAEIVCLGEMGFHTVAGVHGAEAADIDQWQLVNIADGPRLAFGGADFAGGILQPGGQLNGFSRTSTGGAGTAGVYEGPSMIPAPTPIPEPAMAGLVAGGIFGMILKRRARRGVS